MGKNKDRIDQTSFGIGTPETSVSTGTSNWFNYGTDGYLSANDRELFAREENKEPWWRTQFFISEPVLFGMWDGVFTSCLINIFGVIIFLRSGWIVGQAGTIQAVFIVLATVGIGLIVVLSAIGICERCRMESGGVYFLLSHVLGSRSAAAVGLLYVFGQAVGCALSLLGFGESVAGLLGLSSNKWVQRCFASTAVFFLWLINLVGVKWVIKLQFVLLLILLFAGVDFVVGSFVHTDVKNGFDGWANGDFVPNLFSHYTGGYSWFSVFAVFFPSVTGVLAGINMSGDLSHPARDIPNGTLAALTTATGLYLSFIIVLGSTCTRTTLLTDFSITEKVSAIRVLLLAGIYVSSMSSCLGAMYGTPRVLQSIANEKVIPAISFLSHGKGPNKVPVLATVVVAFIIIIFTLFGDINTLAPIVTQPFLLTYAALDYAYFSLAQTFDIQHKREQRIKRSISKSSGFNSATKRDNEEDLDTLFPERNALKTKQDTNVNANVVVHSKTGNWYSGLCNRWLSLVGALLNVIIMCMIDKNYALLNFALIFIIWCYIGMTSSVIKPGAATDFRLLPFISKIFFRKKSNEYEEIVVTPVYPPIDLESSQMNDDNTDFSNRQPFHQTATVQPMISGAPMDSSNRSPVNILV